jgi:hypothetical protein
MTATAIRNSRESVRNAEVGGATRWYVPRVRVDVALITVLIDDVPSGSDPRGNVCSEDHTARGVGCEVQTSLRAQRLQRD